MPAVPMIVEPAAFGEVARRENLRLAAVLPDHPGDYRLAEAVNYGKQIAIWNIREIMSMAEEAKKAAAAKRDKGENADTDLQQRAQEARVLAQYERTLGRLVLLEQKLIASQATGRSYRDARNRLVDRIAERSERERAQGDSGHS